MGQDVFEISDFADHAFCFGVVGADEIGTDAIFEDFGFTDVDDAVGAVAHEVDAGGVGEQGELGLEGVGGGGRGWEMWWILGLSRSL